MPQALPSLSPFFAEHRRLRDATNQISELTDASAPPEILHFSALRWQFGRALLRTLSLKDRLIYPRIRAHPDAASYALATEFETASAEEYARYAEHLERYPPEWVISDWSGYVAETQVHLERLNARLDREENELFPLINEAPELPPLPFSRCKNWARHGWRMREILGIDRDPLGPNAQVFEFIPPQPTPQETQPYGVAARN